MIKYFAMGHEEETQLENLGKAEELVAKALAKLASGDRRGASAYLNTAIDVIRVTEAVENDHEPTRKYRNIESA